MIIGVSAVFMFSLYSFTVYSLQLGLVALICPWPSTGPLESFTTRDSTRVDLRLATTDERLWDPEVDTQEGDSQLLRKLMQIPPKSTKQRPSWLVQGEACRRLTPISGVPARTGLLSKKLFSPGDFAGVPGRSLRLPPNLAFTL